jgi:hypothetical protein
LTGGLSSLKNQSFKGNQGKPMTQILQTPKGESIAERRQRRDALLTYGSLFAPALKKRLDPLLNTSDLDERTSPPARKVHIRETD